jgi:CRP-like cAMP-binding protein
MTLVFFDEASFRGNSVLDSLSETERREILSHAKIARFAAEELIYDYGDVVDYIYFPLSAVFSTAILMENGSSAEISLTGSEGIIEIFAAFDEQPARHWTSVLLAGSAIKVETAFIRNMLRQSNALKSAFLKIYRNLAAQVSQRAVCNGRHNIAERFCFWLLLVQDRAKTDEIALTHEIIARKLGARRAGITNVAGNLQTAGIIAYNRGTIKILNRKALEKQTCECYFAIQNSLALE